MNILIIRNNYSPDAVTASYTLGAFFQSQGIAYAIDESSSSVAAIRETALALGGMGRVDMVVVLGGDGSILKAANAVWEYGVPIFGINFGHLGFLVNDLGEDGLIQLMAAALSGDVTVDERANLQVDFCQAEQVICSRFALNEVTVARGETGRIIAFDVVIDGCPLMKLRGDGVVLASATGSTAYALSAGGPIVSPSHKGLVVAPLAAHTLTARAVVTGPSDVVEVLLEDNQDNREASFFVDGELVDMREDGIDRVVVRRSEYPTKLLRYKDPGFFDLVNATFFA